MPATDSQILPDSFVRSLGLDRLHKIPNVAVFAEHIAIHPKTKQEVLWDKAALERLATDTNRRITEHLTPTSQQIGHTFHVQNGIKIIRPESDLDIVGYAANFRVVQLNEPAKRWGIVCDCYFLPDRQDVIRKFPYRSIELWYGQSENIIDPVCWLARTPALDLGLVREGSWWEQATIKAGYAAGEFFIAAYSRDDNKALYVMGESGMHEHLEHALTEIEGVCAKHRKLHEVSKEHASESAYQAGFASPTSATLPAQARAGTSAAMSAETATTSEVTPVAKTITERDTETQAAYAKIAELEKENAALRSDKIVQARRAKVIEAGVADAEQFLKDWEGVDDKHFDDALGLVKASYARDELLPVGGKVGETTGLDPLKMSDAWESKATAYMRKEKCPDFKKALKEVGFRGELK